MVRLLPRQRPSPAQTWLILISVQPGAAVTVCSLNCPSPGRKACCSGRPASPARSLHSAHPSPSLPAELHPSFFSDDSSLYLFLALTPLLVRLRLRLLLLLRQHPVGTWCSPRPVAAPGVADHPPAALCCA